MFNAIHNALHWPINALSKAAEKSISYCPGQHRPLMRNATLIGSIALCFLRHTDKYTVPVGAVIIGSLYLWHKLHNDPVTQLFILRDEVLASKKDKTAVLGARLKALWEAHQNTALKPYRELVVKIFNALKDDKEKPALKNYQMQSAVPAKKVEPKTLTQCKLFFDKLLENCTDPQNMAKNKQQAELIRKEMLPLSRTGLKLETGLMEATALLRIIDVIKSGTLPPPVENDTVAFVACAIAKNIKSPKFRTFDAQFWIEFNVLNHKFKNFPFKDKFDAAVQVIKAEISSKS